jgi:hypothetical protein
MNEEKIFETLIRFEPVSWTPVQFLDQNQPMEWSLRPEILARRQFLDDRLVGGGQRIRHLLITGKSIESLSRE